MTGSHLDYGKENKNPQKMWDSYVNRFLKTEMWSKLMLSPCTFIYCQLDGSSIEWTEGN